MSEKNQTELVVVTLSLTVRAEDAARAEANLVAFGEEFVDADWVYADWVDADWVYATALRPAADGEVDQWVDLYADPDDRPHYAAAAVYECQNCDARLLADRLQPLKDVFKRVAPGEPMPAGECPECGAVCHEVKVDD